MSRGELAATIATGLLLAVLVLLPKITEWMGYAR